MVNTPGSITVAVNVIQTAVETALRSIKTKNMLFDLAAEWRLVSDAPYDPEPFLYMGRTGLDDPYPHDLPPGPGGHIERRVVLTTPWTRYERPPA